MRAVGGVRSAPRQPRQRGCGDCRGLESPGGSGPGRGGRLRHPLRAVGAGFASEPWAASCGAAAGGAAWGPLTREQGFAPHVNTSAPHVPFHGPQQARERALAGLAVGHTPRADPSLLAWEAGVWSRAASCRGQKTGHGGASEAGAGLPVPPAPCSTPCLGGGAHCPPRLGLTGHSTPVVLSDQPVSRGQCRSRVLGEDWVERTVYCPVPGKCLL